MSLVRESGISGVRKHFQGEFEANNDVDITRNPGASEMK